MRSFMQLFAPAVLAAVLAGCAGGPAINWNNARALKPDMDQRQVTSLLGQPYMVKSIGKDEQRLVWIHSNAFTGASTIALTFKAGRLVDVPTIPDSFK